MKDTESYSLFLWNDIFEWGEQVMLVAYYNKHFIPILTFPTLSLLSSKEQGCKDFLKTVLTLSCWYSLDSSRCVLSDEYLCAKVSVNFKVFCIILYWPISHQQQKG